jgi:hypothetical protein
MTINCGNQLAMWIKKRTSLALFGTLTLMLIWGCAPRLAPAVPDGIVLQPGRYLTSVYRVPDFPAARTVYALEPFTIQAAQRVDPQSLQAQLQDELSRAFLANGLKIDPKSDTVLRGTVQTVEIRGPSLRFITGKITAYLTLSGAISRGDETLFAFQDCISLASPVNPGPPAPRETELLLHQAVRTFALHLLNELLLY